MRRLRKVSVSFGLVMVGSLALTGVSLAQVDEIVVTAQKREQSLQDVPIAITAISGEDLRLSGVQDVNDLQYSAPSLFVNTTNTPSTTTSFRIRGVGTTGNNVGLEGAVGFFLDGVYRSRAGIALSDLQDVERVEILRGPQGTLFGKNTSAGAISIITKKPSNDYEGSLEMEYGGHDLFRTRGMVNIPISPDVLALRMTGGYNKRDGFIDDIDDDDSYNDKDRWNIKGQALFTPNEDVEVRLIMDYTEADESCCSTVRKINGPTAPLVALLAAANGRTGPLEENLTKEKVSIDGLVSNDFEDWGFSGEVDWDIGEVTVTSITSYREHSAFNENDVDFTGAAILDQTTEFTNEQFTQEIRVGGYAENFIGKGLNWMAGFYYADEKFFRDNRLSFGAQGDVYAITLLGLGGSPIIPPVGTYADGTGTLELYNQDGKSWSIFAHGTLDITDQLAITGGIRYNDEEKDGSGMITETHGAVGVPFGVLPFLTPQQDYVASLNEDELTGTAKIQYRWTDDMMTYWSYSRGYKAGGINLDRSAAGPEFGTSCVGTVVAAPFTACDPLDPTFSGEFADNWEGGIRSTWFDGMMTLNVTAFFEKFYDFQLNTFDGLNFTIENVPGATSKGIEAEWNIVPNDYITWTGGINWVKAQYNDSVGPPSPADPPLGGRVLTNAPKWTGVTAVNIVSDPVAAVLDLRVFARGELFFSSSRQTGSDLDPLKKEGSYVLFNSRVGVRSEMGWETSVWCRNCFNEEYLSIAFDSVAQGGSYDGFVGNPREWGLMASYRF